MLSLFRVKELPVDPLLRIGKAGLMQSSAKIELQLWDVGSGDRRTLISLDL
jgi:hypothetical protein